MTRPVSTFCLIASSLTVAAPLSAIGCGPTPEQQRARTQEEFREAFANRDLDASSRELAHPKRVLVAKGPSPVVFDMREAGTVHITDLTTGQEIVAADALREQYVSVNENTGVLVGSKRVMPGPLTQGHEYGIYVDVSGGESFKSNVSLPAAPARPATIDLTPKPTTTAPASRPWNLHPFNTATQPASDDRSNP